MKDSYQVIQECRARHNKKVYYTRKANHQCTKCGAALPEGHTCLMCDECRIKNNEKSQQIYHERRANGLCVECGAPVYNGSSRCFEHALRATEKAKKSQHKKKAAQTAIEIKI